jgi:hypothetical protein
VTAATQARDDDCFTPFADIHGARDTTGECTCDSASQGVTAVGFTQCGTNAST